MSKKTNTTIGVDFRSEYKRVVAAAKAGGETLAAFVRRTVLEALKR